MSRKTYIKQWLAGATLGMAIALLVWPATGWLVRTQLRVAALEPGPLETGWFNSKPGDSQLAQFREEHRTAEQHPGDFGMQVRPGPDHDRVDRVVTVVRAVLFARTQIALFLPRGAVGQLG